MNVEKAYAKINLSLDILGLRPDGFHDIESLMQMTDLWDKLTMTPSEKGVVTVRSDSLVLPSNSKNICYKAAMIFFEHFSIPPRGFDIHIQKRIPVSAGLGGGSADAAAVIRLLAREFGISDREALLKAAAATGSDVPFCLVGGSALCRGRGEVMERVESSPAEIHAVIAKNTSGLSTPQIYASYDKLSVPPAHGEFGRCVQALASGDARGLADAMFNVMEAVSIPKRPKIAKLKRKMLELGAYGAMMSGSGPSVFGIFPDRESAQNCEAALRKQKITAHAVKFMNNPLL